MAAIKLRRSSVAGKVPATADLALGELAVNTTDGKIFFKKNDGADAIVQIANTDTPTFTGTVAVDKLEVQGPGGDEGGEILLRKPQTNTSISGAGVVIDIYQNKLRIWEDGGSNRGVFFNLLAANVGVGTNLLNTQAILSANTSTTNLDLSDNNDFVITLTTNTTFTLTNIDKKLGASGTIVVKQDATGGRTFTKAAEMKTPLGGAGIAQVTAANSLSVLSYYVVDANTVLINYIGNFA
jgi:hypothetical protein